MARRTGWKSLSPRTRDRYTAAARSGRLTGEPVPEREARRAAYNWWRSGGDLRGARGHVPKTATGLPVVGAAGRSSTGHGTDADRALLRVWRDTLAPDWIPPSRGMLADDAAAILAQLPSPARWGNVHFQPHADGSWGITVEGKGRAYDRTVTLPDRTSAMAVMNLLSGLGPAADWPGWKVWERWDDERYDFDVADTDTVA